MKHPPGPLAFSFLLHGGHLHVPKYTRRQSKLEVDQAYGRAENANDIWGYLESGIRKERRGIRGKRNRRGEANGIHTPFVYTYL